MRCVGWEGPCGKYKAVNYRMRTAYADDKLNYRVLCPACQELCRAYWNDMWAEYYSGCL